MFFRLLITFCIATSSFSQALAQNNKPVRVALLIGNESYAPEVGRLKNPVNDIRLIAQSLYKIGFEKSRVKLVENADRATILRSVDDYANALRDAGRGAVGFFYYSGHGAANEIDSANYLIPVGVKKLDRSAWYKSVPLSRIVRTLSRRASDAAHFVVFDACRNILNLPTRGAGKGFKPVREQRGMLIAFSTDPGQTATDAGERSGPYAEALASELTRPGQHHLDLFQNVKETVYRRTSGQLPWERNGLLSRIYLSERPEVKDARDIWNSGKLAQSMDRGALAAFRQQFRQRAPYWSHLAEKRLAALDQAEKQRRELEKKKQDASAGQNADAKRNATAEPGKKAEKVGNLVVPPIPLNSASDLPPKPPLDLQTLTRDAQFELRRLGCYDGPIDGDWGAGSRSALTRFNQIQGSSHAVSTPTLAALRALKLKQEPVCTDTAQDNQPQRYLFDGLWYMYHKNVAGCRTEQEKKGIHVTNGVVVCCNGRSGRVSQTGRFRVTQTVKNSKGQSFVGVFTGKFQGDSGTGQFVWRRRGQHSGGNCRGSLVLIKMY